MKQLKNFSGLDVEDSPPLDPAGETPIAIPADVHFCIFLAAFAAALEHGMGSAPDTTVVRLASVL